MQLHRTIGALGALLTAGALGQSALAQDFAGQTLRVATFGGSWQAWVSANVEPIFHAATGANVEYVQGFPMRHLTTLVSTAGQAPPFDVVELSDDVTFEALAQGLLHTGMDMDLIPNAQHLPEAWRNIEDAGPAYFAVYEGVIYDSARFAEAGLEPPTSWDDLANPALAGHVAIPDVAFTYRPIYAAINLERTGDQANFQGSLDWIASLTDPIIYSDAPTLQTRFDGGEIWAVVGGAGYLLRLSANNPNLEFTMFDVPGVGDGVGALAHLRIVAGSPNVELAHHWIDAFLSTEAQVSMVQTIGFAPVNLQAAAVVAGNPELEGLVLNDAAEMESLFSADWSLLNPVLPDWLDQWNRTVRR